MGTAQGELRPPPWGAVSPPGTWNASALEGHISFGFSSLLAKAWIYDEA